MGLGEIRSEKAAKSKTTKATILNIKTVELNHPANDRFLLFELFFARIKQLLFFFFG